MSGSNEIELVHLVAEQLDAQPLLFVRGIDLDDVATDPERAASEVVIVPLVLHLHQLPQHLLAADPLAALERQQHPVVRLGRTETVDARDAGDDDHVAALEERPGRRQPHPVDLVVDRRLLLDVRIGRGHVRFRLVVVVVADEVLDGVLGEEAAEFLEQLCCQRLVVHHHQRRAVHSGNGVRHRERLSGAGNAEQDLMRIPARQRFGQLGDRLRLVARQLEIGHEVEAVVQRRHVNLTIVPEAER